MNWGLVQNKKQAQLLLLKKLDSALDVLPDSNINKSVDSEYSAVVTFERKYLRDGYLYFAYKYYGRPTDTRIEEYYSVNLEEDANSDIYTDLFYNNHNLSYRRYHTHNIQAEWNRFISGRSKLMFTVRGRLLKDKMYGTQHLIDAINPLSEQTIFTDTHLTQGYGLFQASYLYSGNKFEIQPTLMFQEYYNKQLINNDEVNKFKSHKFYITPNLQLFWLISQQINLMATYNMNRSVATIWQLNPFRDYSELGQVSYGTPSLKPETAHQINAYLSWSKGIWFLRFTTANRFSSDLILQNRFLDGDLLNITFTNAAKCTENSMSLYVRGRFKRFSVSAFTSANYVNYKSYKGVIGGNNGWYVNTNANFEFDFGKEWYGSLTGQFNSTKIYFQGNGGKNFAYNLALSKSILRDRLNFSLRASSIIPIWYKRKSYERSEGYYSLTTEKIYHASWEFSVRWNFAT